jgi:signal transduction histidine kinase
MCSFRQSDGYNPLKEFTMTAASYVPLTPGTVKQARRLLSLLQWVVPLALFLLATIYEYIEEPISLNLSMEVVLFGIVGPSAVALTIFYIRRLVNAQDRAQLQLEALNQQLENIVRERTTALEQRNAELARANLALYKLDEMKSEFVAMVSHELRAPLTTLNGGLELALQAKDSIPQSARGVLEIMVTESKRLTDFVQTILDISRLDAGKLSINLGPVAVQPLMEQAVGVILAQSQRQILWDISSNLPPVWADEVLLAQIVRNLIRNADQYTSPEHPLHISACIVDGNHIRISVRDHGPGITPQMQERIFERFVRGQGTGSMPAGWGLGLYLAYKLTTAQNGQISVVSPVSGNKQTPGSEFSVLMPIANAPEDI